MLIRRAVICIYVFKIHDFLQAGRKKDYCRAISILIFFLNNVKMVVNFGYIGIRTQEIR